MRELQQEELHSINGGVEQPIIMDCQHSFYAPSLLAITGGAIGALYSMGTDKMWPHATRGAVIGLVLGFLLEVPLTLGKAAWDYWRQD